MLSYADFTGQSNLWIAQLNRSFLSSTFKENIIGEKEREVKHLKKLLHVLIDILYSGFKNIVEIDYINRII